MKKVILSFITFLILATTFTTKAQITLEHTFDNDYQLNSVYYFNTEKATFFATIDQINKQINIFNSDYSLYKTVNPIVPSETYSGGLICFYFSSNLFNSDDKIEFVLGCVGSWGINLVLYNEDGLDLKEFGNSYNSGYPLVFRTLSNEDKLVISRQNINSSVYTTDIFPLHGSLPNAVNALEPVQSSSPYPNPAKQIINHPYQLEPGKQTTMSIYDMNGKLITTKQIDSAFDEILLDVSAYPKSMYVYEYNGKSGKFVVE